MRLITEWRTMLWGAAVNWVAVVLGGLVGALSSTYLAVFAVIGFIPSPALQLPLAIFVGAVVVGGPIALTRLIRQPALEAKIEEKIEEKRQEAASDAA